MEKREKELEKEKEKKKKEKEDKDNEKQKLRDEKEKEKAKSRQKEKQKKMENDKKREFNEKENERLLMEKQRELEEKELEKEKNREKERERLDKEFEKKKERDNEIREGHLKAKEEIDREKEERDKMKMKEKEERDKQREKEREEKDKLREKEKDQRKKMEERNKKDREEKERMKQREKEEKYKLKEERDKQRQKEREESEREKKREKEKREKEKQKLRDERRRYNERFQNSNYKLIAKNLRNSSSKNKINSPFGLPQTHSQGNYYQRQAYNSKKFLHVRKRRFSHRRIQPKNRIPRVEPKKKLGKTSMKIIKPKRYDEDETDSEVIDFDDQLLKFPRFKAKYGKNYVLKKPNKNKFVNLTSYISNHSGKNIIDYKRPEMERKMGETKKTNLTISEVEEEEGKNYKKRRMPLSKVKPKNSKFNMNKKMREILGKQYKYLVNDPLNPYGTCWPSNFLKMGYDTGFEYDNFQSGVPVLKLKSLAKKPLPPVKKKGQGLHFNNEGNNFVSPNKVGMKQLFPNNTAKKTIIHEEIKDDKDNIKINKSQTIKASSNNNE